MKLPESAVRSFPQERQGIGLKGLSDVWRHEGLQHRLCGRRRRLVQPPGQRHVKAKILHDVRVPPCNEVFILTRRERRGTSASQIILGERRTKRVEITNDRRREFRQRHRVSGGDQREETIKAVQAERSCKRRTKVSGESSDGCFQIRSGGAVRQPERRLERAVESVLSRARRNLGDIELLRSGRMLYFGARNRIPSQPRGAKVREWAFRRRVIDGIAREFHDPSPPCNARYGCTSNDI